MKTRIVRFGIGLAILGNAAAPAFAGCTSPSTQVTDVGGGTIATLTFLATGGGSLNGTITLSNPNLVVTRINSNGNLSATAVATGFLNITSGNTPSNTANFSYSGSLTGWSSAAAVSGANSDQVVFTSPTTSNTLTIGGTLPNPTAVYAAASAPLATVLTGNTACVGTPPTGTPGTPWTNQEFHQAGGALIDWKQGAINPDPTKTIGTWAITGTGTSTRVTYLYNGSGGGTYSVWKNTDGSYSFCNGTTVVANATIKSGQGACP